MRAYLLATTAAAALLAAMPAHAQNATWSTAPGSSDFNTAANWTPATVPTGTAFFGASTITGLTFNPGAVNSLGGFTFNAGAPAYSFSLGTASTLTFTGAGIVNNSSNAPTFSLPFTSLLAFTNSSTAGNAIITNSGTNSVTQFFNSSTAANATITNTGSGFTAFNDTSTAGNATITSGGGGFASFLGSSTAGNATLTANFLGFTTFGNTSTAGNATITANLGGSTSFANSSTAGNATLIANNGGTTQFSQFSTAGNATLTANFRWNYAIQRRWHGGQCDGHHQSRWNHAVLPIQQRRQCGVHHPGGRRIRHVRRVLGDDGGLDCGRRDLLPRLECAHRRQQQSQHDGRRHDQRRRRLGRKRRLLGEGRHRNTDARRHQYLHRGDHCERRRAGRERLDRVVDPHHGEQRRCALRQRHRGLDRRQCRRFPRSRQFPRHDDRRRRSHNSAQRFLRRAGEPADGFEDQCDRQRLAGRHRRRRLLPRLLSRAELHNFDGRQPAHRQVGGF